MSNEFEVPVAKMDLPTATTQLRKTKSALELCGSRLARFLTFLGIGFTTSIGLAIKVSPQDAENLDTDLVKFLIGTATLTVVSVIGAVVNAIQQEKLVERRDAIEDRMEQLDALPPASVERSFLAKILGRA